MKLANQTAVIIGAGSGMGAATAELFAAEGARLVLADIDAAGVEARAAGLRAQGRPALAVKTDVTQEADVIALAAAAEREWGAVDVLVTTVGLSRPQPFAELSLDAWLTTFHTNVTGVFLACREFGKRMIPRRAGAIVLFGSTASVAGVPRMADYTAAKHAVLGLTRALAVEWGQYNIRVNCVCPGATATPLLMQATDEKWRAGRLKRIPLHRFGAVADQARAALFLASADSAYLTGAWLPVDGGVAAMAPGTTEENL
jgi:NAD(P)-dependent dehydrogenase (short-subunit alcohol dehydrogenase family)